MLWGLWLGLSVMGGASVYYYPLFVLTMLVVPAVWAVMAFRTHPLMLLAASALVIGLHVWKRNTLISVFAGVVCYMLLVQLVF